MNPSRASRLDPGRDPSDRGDVALPGRLRVAAAQMVFESTVEGNLARIETACSDAAREGADVLLLPECATTGYACDFGQVKPAAVHAALTALGAFAARHRIHLLAGSPVFRGRKLFNALLVFGRRGNLVHTYAKCQFLELATRKYAMESLQQPRFLARHWLRMLVEMRRRVRENDRTFQQAFRGGRDR
jgi:hypothetical protein